MIPSPPPQMTVSALGKRTLHVRLVDRSTDISLMFDTDK